MKVSDEKARIILLIMQLILYMIASAGAIVVIVIKELSFLEGVLIFWPIIVGAIGGMVINMLGKKNYY